MLSYPVAALALWYACADFEIWRASLDSRLSSWVFGGASVIPKAGYDADYRTAGGVVGSTRYNNALGVLQSEVIIVNPGLPDEFQAVSTPPLILASWATAWLACSLCT